MIIRVTVTIFHLSNQVREQDIKALKRIMGKRKKNEVSKENKR